MRVTVAGGTGFIGRRLIARLGRRGDDITVLSRNPARVRRLDGAARILRWDPEAGAPPVEAIEGKEAVVNLLGESIAKRWSAARKTRIRASRVVGTRNLVSGIAAASRRPAVLVSGSAVGYYGARGDETLDESAPPGGDFLASVCIEWEAAAMRAGPSGVRVVPLRTGFVLGAGGGGLRSMLTPFRLGLGGRVGSGRQWVSWIHIDDLCGLILFAIDRGDLAGPTNGTAPNPARNAEFAATLGRALGMPAILPAPAFVLRVLLGEMADALLVQGQRVVPRRADESGYRFLHPHLDEALSHLLEGGGRGRAGRR
jgi:uncharacterized protein (TIGR01777 family)